MKLLLTKEDRLRYIGFDDRCAALLGIPLLSFLAFFVFKTNWHGPLVGDSLAACYLLAVLHTTVYWFVIRTWVVVLRQRFPNQSQTPVRSLFMGLGVLVVVFLRESVARFWLHHVEPDMAALGWESLPPLYTFVVSMTLCCLLLAIYESAYFFAKYRQSMIERERLAKEHARGQLGVLRQQMNPHFLFNSLNTLVNIIPEDPRQATLFTQRLSAVYRRLLEWRQHELITLEEEIDALQDYVFLMQTRFEDKLQVCYRFGARAPVQCAGEGQDRVELPAAYRAYRVVPLATQLLVENAIKHNVVSQQSPLRIDIVLADGRIRVEHPLHPRAESAAESTGWGHQNLRARYALVGERPVVIEATGGRYRVSVPVFTVRQPARVSQ